MEEGAMSMKGRPVVVLVMSVLLLTAVPAVSATQQGSQARTSDTVTLYLENDLFGFHNKDRYYTHGTKLSWISRDLTNYREIQSIPSWMHGLIEKVPYVNKPESVHTVSISLGQNIYTPEDKERSDLVLDDRPYAGITYLGLGLQRKTAQRMDAFELALGIVGRHSYARDCQIELHRNVGSEKPQGWSHQLRDEPVFNLFLERKRKILQYRVSGGFGYDVIPHLGVSLGNVNTGVNLGGQARFGWNLPNDFGTYLIRSGSDTAAPIDDTDPRFNQPRERFGAHLFFAVNGKAVAHTVFLDGNTFRDSHSVDKKHFVADVIGGVGVIINRVKITYSHVYRTKEFKLQKSGHQFGSVSLSFTF